MIAIDSGLCQEGIKIWSNLCDTSRTIKSWIVNQVGYFEGLQLFGRKWLVERLQSFGLVHVVTQPDGERIGVKNHRHAKRYTFKRYWRISSELA